MKNGGCAINIIIGRVKNGVKQWNSMIFDGKSAHFINIVSTQSQHCFNTVSTLFQHCFNILGTFL